MRTKPIWQLPIGANIHDNQTVSYRAWAPKVDSLSLKFPSAIPIPMKKDEQDYYTITLPQSEIEEDYFFNLNHQKDLPDPASRCQPHGVHGPSRLINIHFKWTDEKWKGIPIEEYIIYELHVGTFTPKGTFEGVIDKLPHLKELGITAIELMPVSQCPGNHNWGYDGVYPYAPASYYGGSQGLKSLINACHEQELAVILDVVYNHLGPEGNYLNEYGFYFTNHYHSPWGNAVNFDGSYSDPVRDYFINNALHWLVEYHIDALRLDAIHAIYDYSAHHILEELTSRFHSLANQLGHQAHIIAESDLNDVKIITPNSHGGFGLDAQWSDDFHHALTTLLTIKTHGFFQDFGHIEQLSKAIKKTFVYDGIYSQHRQRKHGNSVESFPGKQFVIATQNHDQIANGSHGNRMGMEMTFEQEKLAAAILFATPNLPLLFMGQEWSASSPFYYFTSFKSSELAQAVSEGYIKENLWHLTDKKIDPQDDQTYEISKLNWEEIKETKHAKCLQYYSEWFKLRKASPSLYNLQKEETTVSTDTDGKWLTIQRNHSRESSLLLCNFANTPQTFHIPLGRWKIILCSSEAQFGGPLQKVPPLENDQITTPEFSATLLQSYTNRE